MRGWGAQRQCMRNEKMTVLSLKLVGKSDNTDLSGFTEHEKQKILIYFLHRCSTAHCYLGCPYAQRALKSIPRILSMLLNHFCVCSACDEILSPYAQHAVKSFPRMLSVRWNRFPVCSACVQMSM
jgi:hypothetical protein